MASEWADKRLDDLKVTVDDGFKEVEGRLDRMDGRIDNVNRTMAIGFISMCTVTVGGFASLIALFATQH